MTEQEQRDAGDCVWIILEAKRQLEDAREKLFAVLGPTQAVLTLSSVDDVLRRAIVAYEWGDEAYLHQ